MRKFMYLAVALATMMFVACGEKASEPESYGVTTGGGLNASGTNFKAFDRVDDLSNFPFTVELKEDKAVVSADLKLKRTEEEIKGELGQVQVAVLTMGDSDFRMDLDGDLEVFKKAAAEPAGTEGVYTFKTEVDKALLDSINGKKCSLTLVVM